VQHSVRDGTHVRDWLVCTAVCASQSVHVACAAVCASQSVHVACAAVRASQSVHLACAAVCASQCAHLACAAVCASQCAHLACAAVCASQSVHVTCTAGVHHFALIWRVNVSREQQKPCKSHQCPTCQTRESDSPEPSCDLRWWTR
jgi:hypothetical protein